jgi:single-strand DNA-binding protein
MLNRTILMGRLTRDPELRQTTNETPVTSFSLAVNRPRYKETEPVTDFINIVAWRKTAEFACQYFRKGMLVAVEGRLQIRSYEDKEGVKRKAVEVVADQVHFAERKKENGEANGNGNGGMPSDFIPDFDMDDDGELPF